MTKTIPIPLRKNLIALAIPLSLFGILIFIMTSSLASKSDTLNLAITADLLLTVPLIYFLLIRKTNIPKTTVIPVMLVGLLLGTYFLPKDSQSYLALFKTWALPVIEISILSFVVIKVRVAIGKYKKLKGSSPDFYSALKSTCYEILPHKLVPAFATEVAVLYYGFISWKNRPLGENEFSYHKDSGTPALLGAFVFIIAIETMALHLLLSQWSSLAAWILTALSTYTALEVFGFAKSLSKRPISIDQTSLHLRYGILNEAEIPLSDIEKIEVSGRPLEKDKLTQTLSPLGSLESHNMILTLKKTHQLSGIYGLKKRFRRIGFYVDESGEFKEKVSGVLEEV